MSEKKAIYAGSFDPLTNGHLDVLHGALALADTVFVAIGIHPGKKPLFSFEERLRLIEEVGEAQLGADHARLRVVAFDGLVVDVSDTADAHSLGLPVAVEETLMDSDDRKTALAGRVLEFIDRLAGRQ